MSAEFNIELDPSRKLLDVTMGGFFTVDDVARYHAAVHDATRRLGGLPSDQRMICDITAMRIQPQNVVQAFCEVVADPKYKHRKVAMVVASSLARLQAQRTTGDRDARYFATRAEAEAWLFGPVKAAA